MTDLPDFDAIRALCIGDLMLDRFIDGTVSRISPESPVPIIQLSGTQSVPGGAANVARNLSALGSNCTLIGVVGDDAAGHELGTLLSACGRIDPVLVVDHGRATTEKVRFVASGQHLLRADREDAGNVSDQAADAILRCVAERIDDYGVVILSDYAKGVLSDRVIAGIIDVARAASVPVVVDPKSVRIARYAGATVVTPNAQEATAATGIEIRTDDDARRAAERMLYESGVEAVLLTRSEHGMLLVGADGHVSHVEASAREVFDVVGAGDTVVATLALCVGTGLALERSARIANAAAGVVVSKHGTATLTRSELINELSRLSRIGVPSSLVKVMSSAAAAQLRGRWEKDGLKVGFTNGCFDILHVGHVGLLEFARSQCDRLIVAVNSDSSTARLKGPERPINREEDRAQIIGALGFVDAVVIFEDDTPYGLIEQIQPDVLVKGSDYTIEQIVGHDIVQKRGGSVVTFDLVAGRSTTDIIAKAGITVGARA